MTLPGVANRREFTSDYPLQEAIVSCLHASLEKHVFAMCGLLAPCEACLYSCDS